MRQKRIRKNSVRGLFLLMLAGVVDTWCDLHYSRVMSRLNGFDYSYPTLTKAVRQMLADEEIVIEGERVRLGVGGEKLLKEMGMIKDRHRKWDGWWRLVVFDLPEKQRKVRDELRDLLKNAGMGEWQESVYLTPHPVMDLVNQFMVERGIEKQVVCLEAKRLGVGDELALVDRVFRLDERSRELKGLITEGETAMKVMDKSVMDWWYRVYEWELVDPKLPDELVSKKWLAQVQRLGQIKAKVGQSMASEA